MSFVGIEYTFHLYYENNKKLYPTNLESVQAFNNLFRISYKQIYYAFSRTFITHFWERLLWGFFSKLSLEVRIQLSWTVPTVNGEWPPKWRASPTIQVNTFWRQFSALLGNLIVSFVVVIRTCRRDCSKKLQNVKVK